MVRLFAKPASSKTLELSVEPSERASEGGTLSSMSGFSSTNPSVIVVDRPVRTRGCTNTPSQRVVHMVLGCQGVGRDAALSSPSPTLTHWGSKRCTSLPHLAVTLGHENITTGGSAQRRSCAAVAWWCLRATPSYSSEMPNAPAGRPPQAGRAAVGTNDDVINVLASPPVRVLAPTVEKKANLHRVGKQAHNPLSSGPTRGEMYYGNYSSSTYARDCFPSLWSTHGLSKNVGRTTEGGDGVGLAVCAIVSIEHVRR